MSLSLGCFVQFKGYQLAKDVKNWIGPTTQSGVWDAWLIRHSLSASWLGLVYPVNQSLWDLSLLTPDQRNLRGDLIAAYNCLKKCYKDNRSELFSVVAHILRRSDSHKMPPGRFYLDIRNNFISRKMAQQTNWSPREPLKSLSLQVCQSWVSKI